jgi:hypothetical protein
VIGKLLGHAPRSVTEIHYRPVRPHEMVEGLERLDYGIDPTIAWGSGYRQLALF